MKYIKTKDGIKKVFRKLKDGFYLVKVNKYKYYHYYPDCEVADTIEELCDLFTYIQEDGKHWISHFRTFKDTKEECDYKELYGAIWTDKGLIFVAKMNDDGELVLI